MSDAPPHNPQTIEALRRSQANFHTLVEHSPDAIFVHRNGVLVYVNRAFLAWYGGADGASLVGQSVFVFIDPAERERVEQRIRQANATEGPVPGLFEVRFVRPDGETREMQTNSMRMDFDGETATVVFARDVTEHRQMEARLQMSDRLASLGTLAAGVAHEINNPLSYVVANLEQASEAMRAQPPADVEAVRRLLDEAREGADRVRRIVLGLRAFSRAGEHARAPTDVRALLDRAIAMTGNELRHRARIVTRYQDVEPVLADAGQLLQVFVNLLVNAMQAIPEGRAGDDEVRVSCASDARGRVVVEVSDTGEGMTAEVQKRIFEPFFTTKPIGVGTGLGLFVCHGVVAGHGGEMSVESAPGRGSTFRVTLPACDRLAQVATPAATGAVGARTGRVLVIDDDARVAHAIARILEEHEVVVETSARAALERLAGGDRFDVILCDLMMPGMTGMDLHAELSRVRPEAAARMVFATGGAFTEQAARFLEQAPNARLDKPFSSSDLRRVVAERMAT